jgi:SAM-dependent methyltransferase
MDSNDETYPIEIDPFFVEDLRQMERAVNYRDWQFRIIEPFLGKRVLEVGGGIGNFTPQLAEGERNVVSLEPNEFCFRRLEEKTRNLPNVKLIKATVESLDAAVAHEDPFDTIVLMNVLEHIENDLATLLALRRRLVPNGKVVVLVPAGQWAFGHTDKRLGHYRRYGKNDARHLFKEAGLSLQTIRFYNFIGIWAWWWNARVSRLESQSDNQIRIFDKWLVPVIARIEKHIRPPLGQSLLLIGQNNN